MIDADNKPLRTEESTHTDPDYDEIDDHSMALKHAMVSSARQNSQLSLLKCFLACLTSTA